MRFLADMGVSMRVVDWLRREGHEAFHLRERGLTRAPDAGTFRIAADEQRVVLTFDLDFSEIASFSGQSSVSVITFRLRDARSSRVIERLAAVLAKSAEAIRAGAIVSVDDARHRIRRLPIGSE